MINKDKLVSFLKYYSIEYIDSGPNVGKSNINIRCPLCSNDPSFHMGIDYTTGRYGCWRDSTHRGKNVGYLLSKILKISVSTISRDLGLVTTLSSDDMSTALNILECTDDINNEKIIPSVEKLSFKNSFVSLYNNNRDSKYIEPALTYLENRGFLKVDGIAKYYNLQYSYYGDWKYRIIFPIYKNKKLVTWVGRSIVDTVRPKYKDLPIQESVAHCKSCLFDYDNLLKGGDLLCITEGVIDAAKVNLPSRGVRATALFTKTITDNQIDLLCSLKGKFNKFFILLDEDAFSNALTLAEKLGPYLNVGVVSTNYNYDDPGSIPQHLVFKELQKWKDGLL